MQHEELQVLQKIDEQLHGLSMQISMHRFMNPINVEQERKAFFSKKKSNPVFFYPDVNKELLQKIEKSLIALEIPGSSIFSELLHRKAAHMIHSVRALQARDTNAFFEHLEASIPFPALEEVQRAEKILEKWKAQPVKKAKKKNFLSAEELKVRVETALSEMKISGALVELRGLHSARMSVIDGTTIVIRKGARFNERTVPALLAHEIGVHVTRAFNGSAQPLRMFQNSTPGYLATEEGLGAIASRMFRESPFFSSVALSLVAVDYARSHSFRDTYNMLHEKWGVGEKKAWRYALRAKRGMTQTKQAGANPRDAQYLRGIFEVESYLQSGGQLADLFMGKVSVHDVASLLGQPEMQPAKIVPEFFTGKESAVLGLLEENQ